MMQGRKQLRSWLTLPISDLSELTRRQDGIDYFRHHPDKRELSRAALARAFDPVAHVRRLASRQRPPSRADLRRLSDCLSAIRQIAGLFGQIELASVLHDIRAYLASAFDLEDQNMLGIIAAGHRALDDLKQRLADLPQLLQQARPDRLVTVAAH